MASAEVVRIEQRTHMQTPMDGDVALADFGKALINYLEKYDRNLTRDQRTDLISALRNVAWRLGKHA